MRAGARGVGMAVATALVATLLAAVPAEGAPSEESQVVADVGQEVRKCSETEATVAVTPGRRG